MKTLITTFIVVSCFWSCSNELANQDNAVITTNTANSAGRPNPGADENRNTLSIGNQKGDLEPSLKAGNFKVDSYVDDQLESSDFYKGGRIYKRIAYNTQTKKEDGEARYFYRGDGSLDRIEMKEPDGSIKIDSDLARHKRDLELQLRIIRSNGIDFPLPDIAVNEVQDLSSILSAANQYSDFTRETQTDGNRKVIKFVNFNKTGRFPNSTFAYLIGNGDFIKIQDYELTLEGNHPTKEVLKTSDGELTRTYLYKDGKLTGVVYQFTDLESRTNSLEKRFEYHELK